MFEIGIPGITSFSKKNTTPPLVVTPPTSDLGVRSKAPTIATVTKLLSSPVITQ